MKDSVEVIKELSSELKTERNSFDKNCWLRDRNYDDLQMSTKIIKVMGSIFTISLFILPLLNLNTIIYPIIEITRNTAFLSGLLFTSYFMVDKVMFRKYNKKAVENSKMICILSKKIEEEKKNITSNSKVNQIEKLNELKKYVELAREYSKNYERYQTLYAQDLENKYFVSEDEEALTIQEFILDDEKRSKELKKELLLK